MSKIKVVDYTPHPEIIEAATDRAIEQAFLKNPHLVFDSIYYQKQISVVLDEAVGKHHKEISTDRLSKVVLNYLEAHLTKKFQLAQALSDFDANLPDSKVNNVCWQSFKKLVTLANRVKDTGKYFKKMLGLEPDVFVYKMSAVFSRNKEEMHFAYNLYLAMLEDGSIEKKQITIARNVVDRLRQVYYQYNN